jgi:hypothetical protein
MGRFNGINRYKHGITRTNLFLDDEGNCYLPGKGGSFARADWDTELGKLEASLTTRMDPHYNLRRSLHRAEAARFA